MDTRQQHRNLTRFSFNSAVEHSDTPFPPFGDNGITKWLWSVLESADTHCWKSGGGSQRRLVTPLRGMEAMEEVQIEPQKRRLYRRFLSPLPHHVVDGPSYQQHMVVRCLFTEINRFVP
jgi:hypothetical protein